jgi:type II secretory pathway component PulM
MSVQPQSSLQEKLMALLVKVKALLSKDYSLRDLQNLGSLRTGLKEKLSTLKEATQDAAHGVTFTSAVKQWNLQSIICALQGFAIRYRNSLLTLFVIGLLLLMNTFVISPYRQKIQDQLEMRPAQWSSLQSLIKLSKAGTNAAPASVTLLDEMELQKIRGILSSRGFKLGVFRLSTDIPPRLELQASDVMFSVLLDALEELRITWRLYPEQLKVIPTASAGVVDVSGSFLQFTGPSRTPMSGVLQ